MGRPSKLTEKQWAEVSKRLLAGEKIRALAREFGVSEAAVRGKLSAQTQEIKTVANQLVATDAAMRALPVSAQVAAINLAEQLRSISGHLAGAANFGAATAHRLSGIAHAKAQEIDDAQPLAAEGIQSLRDVSALTDLANKASVIGMNLLSANKEMARASLEDTAVLPVKIVVRVEDASQPEPHAQQTAG